ncbi:F-box protein At3g07870-like [Papaver somniferum]|uniref:F-box protein At3g07870-like n=1 Tax=Papaver somniferum TaxID=3469 RepID=UPI000E6FFB71|nr:F-box protein At3g07870-like [Papaver somniferum]
MERVLPEDIILNIFSRVPFESLFECRLVSKTWNYFISNLNSPSSSSSSSDSKVSFISLNMLQSPKFQLLYLEYDETNNNNEQQLRISEINHPPFSRVPYWLSMISGGNAPYQKIKSVIIGSSNGLICLSIPRDGYFGDFDDPLYIFNPVTREYISLPICGGNCLNGRNVFGFGYNSKTNEYKVVRIYYESKGHTEAGQVQVYTLGAGSGWRNKGEIACSLQTNNSYSPGMNVDGEQIQVLGGCLCYVLKARYDTINIWSFKKNNDTSKEEEDSSNWSSVGTVQIQHDNLAQFFYFTKSGNILYWDDKKTALSYDPRTSSIKELLNDGTTGLEVFETISYRSSFVSLKALGEENVKMFDRIN